jgi:hypothetical protein
MRSPLGVGVAALERSSQGFLRFWTGSAAAFLTLTASGLASAPTAEQTGPRTPEALPWSLSARDSGCCVVSG